MMMMRLKIVPIVRVEKLVWRIKIACEQATGELTCLLRIGCTWQNSQCVGDIPTCKSVQDEIDCIINMKGCTWVEDPTCLTDTFHQAIEPTEKDLQISQPSSNNTVVSKTKLVSKDGKVTFWGMIDLPNSFSACTMSINDQECESCSFCTLLKTASYDCTNLMANLARDIHDPECPSDGSTGVVRCVGQDCNGNCICKRVDGTGTGTGVTSSSSSSFISSSSSFQGSSAPSTLILFSIAASTSTLLLNGWIV
jgi:hypothetical protein